VTSDLATTGLTYDQVRAAIGSPSALVLDKQLDHLDPHAQAFVALSPFCVLSTSAADGTVDASPRGDPAGFVRVLDPTHLLLPDRRGNRRIDSMRNIGENPHAGLLFMIPGTNETLRVNGRASLTDDPELLAACAVNGQAPTVGILVTVHEVFMHCARAMLRSRLWDPAGWPARDALPTLGQILHDQIGRSAGSVAELDEMLDEANESLY
jgi:PPOX class probable FMN-dependent enzyme